MNHELIEQRPGLVGGKPCIRGTRISVDLILELLAQGLTTQEIVEAYPHVGRAGVVAALEYAAHTIRSESLYEWRVPTP